MTKNPVICESCPFKDKTSLEKEIFSAFEGKIEKIRKDPNLKQRDFDFFILIRICLNKIEMLSCLNCIGATGENGRPDADKMGSYYCAQALGAKLLGEKKFPEIRDEVTGSFNESVTWQEINSQPDVWDEFKHYVLNGGLEAYYGKHPEHLPKEGSATG